MRLGIIAFVSGNISFLYFFSLDSSKWNLNFQNYAVCVFIAILLFFIVLYKAQTIFVSSRSAFYQQKHQQMYQKVYQYLIIVSLFFISGYFVTAIYVNHFYPVLDLSGIEGKTITVKGHIVSIPDKTKKRQSFMFFISSVERFNQDGKKYWDNSFQGKVKLSWYRTKKQLANQQQWQFDLRLKKPHGLFNGVFDYEKWLYQKRILATGYVRDGVQFDALNMSFAQNNVLFWLATWRQKIADKIDISLPDYPYKGIIKALTIGVRYDIERQQWQQFLTTGTNHLIAISGLHISLISGFVWLLVNRLWRNFSSLNLSYPALYISSVCALLTAVIYAALAGFALPTQRAMIMLSVVFMAVMLKREFLSSYVLLIALFAVIVFDPLSALAPGFWLSFIAVAVIIFIVSARLTCRQTWQKKFWQLSYLQVAIFMGLLAPLVILFQQFSLISPLANIIAVPLMSFVIVPMSLLSLCVLFIYQPLGIEFFNLLEWPLDALFWLLNNLSQWPISLIFLPQPTLISSIMLLIGSFWLLMPKGWPGRWLAVVLLLPTFFIEAEKIPQGDIKITVLDVGQGLATLIRTQNHSLLYDTGDKYSDSFNMADSAILPYLRLQGIKKLDTLLVSHSDRDHAGSFQELVDQIPIEQILAGEPEQLSKNHSLMVKQCEKGQQWQWDQVNFRILSPSKLSPYIKKNNRSCVLHISNTAGQSVLLTGDIEKKVEKQLLASYPQLKADVLLVPHHGSKTSSSLAFLQQLEPEIAVFSFGYKNRFHHPAKQVLQTYYKLPISLYNTNNGAIEIDLHRHNNSFSIIEYRVDKKRFWHREVNDLNLSL